MSYVQTRPAARRNRPPCRRHPLDRLLAGALCPADCRSSWPSSCGELSAAADTGLDDRSPACLPRRVCSCCPRNGSRWWTTEIAVTNRRVIYKTGFIQRNTNEMNMDKVESVRGQAIDPRPPARLRRCENPRHRRRASSRCTTIAQPLELRNHITGVCHGHDVQSPPNSRHLGRPSAIPASPGRGGARPRRRTRMPTRTTSRASPRRSSPRSARSPASRISRISSSTTCRANGWSSRNR